MTHTPQVVKPAQWHQAIESSKEKFSGSGLDFIADIKGSVFFTGFFHNGKIFRWGCHIAPFSLLGFDDKGSHIIGTGVGSVQNIIHVFCALEFTPRIGKAKGATITIGIG